MSRSRPITVLASVVPIALHVAATTVLLGFVLANGTSPRKIRASSR